MLWLLFLVFKRGTGWHIVAVASRVASRREGPVFGPFCVGFACSCLQVLQLPFTVQKGIRASTPLPLIHPFNWFGCLPTEFLHCLSSLRLRLRLLSSPPYAAIFWSTMSPGLWRLEEVTRCSAVPTHSGRKTFPVPLIPLSSQPSCFPPPSTSSKLLWKLAKLL